MKKVVHLIEGEPCHKVRWTESCSGCYESNEGYPPTGAVWDDKAKCYLGAGCHECGYTGKRRRVDFIPIKYAYDVTV